MERLPCQNNLQQLGVALHNHHAEAGRFPPGRGTPTPAIFSAHAYLLPYLERDNLRGLIDYAAPPTTFTVPPATIYSGTRNYAAATSTIRTFVCPADSVNGRVPNSPYAGTNYAANAGSGANTGSLTNADGVFFLGSRMRLDEISDSTSHTAAFSERLMGGGGPGPGDLRRAILEIPGSGDTTAATCQPSNGS